jgi:biopolymer transport protein ExbB
MELLITWLKEYLDITIIGILGFMSFVLLWLAIERYFYLRNVDIYAFSHQDAFHIATTKHLTTIASIGANAPYIGLLGTVLGILITFYDISHSGTVEPAAIMLGLALALKATALGLLVAIPAVLLYNALTRKVEVKMAQFATRHHEEI